MKMKQCKNPEFKISRQHKNMSPEMARSKRDTAAVQKEKNIKGL